MNQDAVLAVRLRDGRELVAIADGMGGHSAGEVASRRALEELLVQLRSGTDLKAAVLAANAAVFAVAGENTAWAGMGTTLVAMLRSGSRYEVANVGDSRAYRVAAGAVTQVTTDHSIAAEAARDPRFAQDVQRSPWRHALTRALGTADSVTVDLFGPFDAREPHALLLCTDGVYRALDETTLLGTISSNRDPWVAARDLTELAYANDSSDNLSAAVILFGESTQSSRSVRTDAQRAERGALIARREGRLKLQMAIIAALLVITIAALVRAL